jgi:hypothetical protein
MAQVGALLDELLTQSTLTVGDTPSVGILFPQSPFALQFR